MTPSSSAWAVASQPCRGGILPTDDTRVSGQAWPLAAVQLIFGGDELERFALLLEGASRTTVFWMGRPRRSACADREVGCRSKDTFGLTIGPCSLSGCSPDSANDAEHSVARSNCVQPSGSCKLSS